MIEPRSQRAPGLLWLAWAVILIIAGAVRFSGLAQRELWFDENCTFYVIHHLYDWPADGPHFQREVGHLPYFFLLQGWTRLAGETIWGMRSLSALIGCLTVAGLGLVGTRMGGRAIGLISMFLAALNPLHIYYSQEARSYTTWLLAVTACVYLICLAARRARGRWWLAYAVVAWGTVLTHYYTLPWLLGTAAAAWIARDRRRFWRQWAVTHLVLGLSLIPVVWFLVVPLAAGGAKPWFREMWLGYPLVLAIPKSLWAMLPSGGYPSYLGALTVATEAASHKLGAAFGYLASWGPTALVGVLVVFAASGGKYARLGEPKRKTTNPADVCLDPSRETNHVTLLLFLFGLSLVYLLAAFGHSWISEPTYIVGRYDLAAWPSLTLGVAVLIEVAARRFNRTAVKHLVRVAATAALAGCSVIAIVGARTVPVSNDLTDRARRIAVTVGPDDLVISLGKYNLFVLYEWHRLGFSAEVISFPPNHDRQLCWYDAEAELTDPARIHAGVATVTEQIRTALNDGRKVWLLAHGEPAGPRWEVDRQLFARLDTMGIEVHPVDEALGLAALVQGATGPSKSK